MGELREHSDIDGKDGYNCLISQLYGLLIIDKPLVFLRVWEKNFKFK